MKVAYTAAIGDTDPIRPPFYQDADWHYVAFTDNPRFRSNVYEVRHIESPKRQVDKARLARRLKVMAHEQFPDAEYSLWFDASFQLTATPDIALHLMGEADMIAFEHPHREHAMQEAQQVVRLGFDSGDVVIPQAQRYIDEGFTQQQSITTTCYMLRRHTPKVEAFNAAWWHEIEHGSWRDQISVDYCAWKHQLNVAYIEGHYKHNPYATWHQYHPHWLKTAATA